MLQPQPHPLPLCQQLPRLQHILNLAPIHRNLSQLIKIFITEIVGLRRDSQEVGPDVAAGGAAEFGVFHRDVDAGLEGGVDVFDAVGGEEEDSFVVFEDAEEDWRGRVPLACDCIGTGGFQIVETAVSVAWVALIVLLNTSVNTSPDGDGDVSSVKELT